MAIVWNGATEGLFKTEVQIDPVTGSVTEYSFEGSLAAMQARINLEAAAGRMVRSSQDGPTLMVVSRAEQFLGEVTTIWTLRTEMVEKDVFALPAADAEAGVYISRAQYRKDIQAAVDQGKPLTGNGPSPVTFPVAHRLYLELARGVEAYMRAYRVLQKKTTVSTSSANRLDLTVEEKIYSTAQINPPTALLINFPSSFPAAPANSVYGWLLRGQELEQVGSKVNIFEEWVFAAWSTTFYAVA